MEMQTLYDYLRIYGPREIGRRIVETFPRSTHPMILQRRSFCA